MAAAFGSWGFLTGGEEPFDPASGHLAAIGRKIDHELIAPDHRAALLHHHIAIDGQAVGLDVDQGLVPGNLLGARDDDEARFRASSKADATLVGLPRLWARLAP